MGSQMCCGHAVPRWVSGCGKESPHSDPQPLSRADQCPTREDPGLVYELELGPLCKDPPVLKIDDAARELAKAATRHAGPIPQPGPAAAADEEPGPTHSLGSTASAVDVEQIRKDVPRTFPDQPSVREASKDVEALLCAYAARDPEVGYCQGMSYIAAVATAHLAPDAAAAEARFSALVSKNRGLWTPGFPLLHVCSSAFEPFCREQLPRLLGHLEGAGITGEMLGTGVLTAEWLSLFARWQPFPALWDTFELIEAEGVGGILSLTAALLEAHAAAILKAADFASLFVLLKDLGRQTPQPDSAGLLRAARAKLPAASEAIARAQMSNQLPSFKSQMSLTRSGSRVLHAPSNSDIINVAEDAHNILTGLALRLKSSFSGGLDTVVEAMGEVVTATTQVTATTLHSGSASSILSAARGKGAAKKSCLCGCIRAPKE